MSYASHRRLTVLFAMVAASTLALVGCSKPVGDGILGPGTVGTADGVVTVYGTISGADAELLKESWAGWEEQNDIHIKYDAIKNFDTQIGVWAKQGNAPDLAIFPKPTLLEDLASRDLIQPVPDVVEANIKQYWSNDWANYGTTEGVMYGAPLTATVKGLIWYSPEQFSTNGWDVPTTWDGLLALSAEMEKTLGAAPWCAGFGSDVWTGDAGTDWIEDLVLRQAGPEPYDRWINHEVKFSDPAIKDAFDSLEKLLLDPSGELAAAAEDKNAVEAGAENGEETKLHVSINATAYNQIPRALSNGTCSLTHQPASFEGLLGDPDIGNLTVGPDGQVWAFLMPSVLAGGNEVTGGGDFVAAFSNDADTVKVQQYLSSPEWANSRVSLGGVISANNGVDPAKASSPILQKAIMILQDQKTTFRFDASDLMPRKVGAGAFRTAMVDWVRKKPVDDILVDIDDSWPQQRELWFSNMAYMN